MKKIGVIVSFIALMVGIGVLNALAFTFCMNCTGKVPITIFRY